MHLPPVASMRCADAAAPVPPAAPTSSDTADTAPCQGLAALTCLCLIQQVQLPLFNSLGQASTAEQAKPRNSACQWAVVPTANQGGSCGAAESQLPAAINELAESAKALRIRSVARSAGAGCVVSDDLNPRYMKISWHSWRSSISVPGRSVQRLYLTLGHRCLGKLMACVLGHRSAFSAVRNYRGNFPFMQGKMVDAAPLPVFQIQPKQTTMPAFGWSIFVQDSPRSHTPTHFTFNREEVRNRRC